MPPYVLTPSDVERHDRDQILRRILACVAAGETVRLPAFDPVASVAGEFSMATVGLEPNPFGGVVAGFRYQFEGEEDLLHLMVLRQDGSALSPEEGQAVAAFVLAAVPPLLVWFRPGERSMHFFVGHDVLPEHIEFFSS